MNQRFLIDYDNPDAGIGHSMGIINRALKIATRNQLQLAYSENQLRKSADKDWGWRIRQSLRKLRGKRPDETHNIGNDLNQMLDLKNLLPSREDLEKKILRREIRLIDLPEFEIHIPSNQHQDDEIYQSVDQFIRSHAGPNIAFRIKNNRFGDYEYASTRGWFIDAYNQARKNFPLAISYRPDKLNIAIHIRRGDLLPGRQFSDLSSRMLPDRWYLQVIDAALNNPRKPVAIHIFSEGKDGQYHSENGAPFSWREHFKKLPYEVHEHIDSDFLSTFHHLINADILVGSKSGMSHLAGMLSEHIKLMPGMWHSYRGADKILELVDSLENNLDKESISSFIKKSQQPN
jgi:hypothetical protein